MSGEPVTPAATVPRSQQRPPLGRLVEPKKGKTTCRSCGGALGQLTVKRTWSFVDPKTKKIKQEVTSTPIAAIFRREDYCDTCRPLHALAHRLHRHGHSWREARAIVGKAIEEIRKRRAADSAPAEAA